MKAIVTGGNSGVGQATATALAAAGHQVVIACRTLAKGEAAAATMVGDVKVQYLDLADLASVRAFADSVDTVDVLVNNAGVLGLPLTRTADGFEAHMGTNHLGHFALTCLLADRITDRVVSVTSSGYQWARLRLDDLNWEVRRYSSGLAYGESKLANLLFIHELARRGITAYAADPGSVNTNIVRDAGPVLQWSSKYVRLITQSPAHGARSTLAAIATTEPSGTYIAPRGLLHQWGEPRPTKLRAKAKDSDAAQRLWDLSSELTGCDVP
ncbi:retinol dehydrogenase [Mycobacterium colombiense]|uniref:SDR family NAD(P)-dependent oxidoreductase n=1 Tax=Mycobacterium colombiense TaxID=339268 RepID=UPI0007F035EC|nr:SDR family NAD(P)-dependent oxidoreductase [Mycobacterium colombiense]OBK68562.1 retinol dehydrogenase [Mycobacterium colombiense]